MRSKTPSYIKRNLNTLLNLKTIWSEYQCIHKIIFMIKKSGLQSILWNTIFHNSKCEKSDEKENQTSEYSLIILARKSELVGLNKYQQLLNTSDRNRIYHKSCMGRNTVVVEITWDQVWQEMIRALNQATMALWFYWVVDPGYTVF